MNISVVEKIRNPAAALPVDIAISSRETWYV